MRVLPILIALSCFSVERQTATDVLITFKLAVKD